MDCTHQLPDQLWAIQGHSFHTTLKIIPLRGYDVILGMDWLEAHSPMEIHWAEKWLQFNHFQKPVRLQGILLVTTIGAPVSQHQLQAFGKFDSILYIVQVQALETIGDDTYQLPQELQ